MSARFHVSTDGAKVCNIVHRASEEDYRHFLVTSDAEGRMAAIQAAMDHLDGKAEARVGANPTYTIAREVRPPESARG